MSLRKRIMLLAAIGMIVATAPMGVISVVMLRTATDRILAERLALGRIAAEHISEELSEGWEQLDRLSNRVALLWRTGKVDAVRVAYDDVAPQMELFSGGIFLTDSTGAVIVYAPAQSLLRLSLVGSLSSVEKTLAEGRSGISEPIRTPSGVSVMVFTVPVRRASGMPIGVVGGIVNLDDSILRSAIKGLAVGNSGHAAIVNETGTVLASTDPTEQFTRGEHPAFFARGIAGGRAFVGPAAETHGDSGGREEMHIMTFAPLTGAPWGLGVGQNEEETFGPVRRLRDRIILFGVGVLVAALLVAWLDTGAVAAPLRLLKEGAERIAGGDLGREIEVRRADELGALARSFEMMRVQLLNSLEEIRRRARASQSLYEVGTEVLSLQDRDAVLQSVAARAVSLLQGDAALVCLVDEARTTASVRAAAGTGQHLLNASRVISTPVDDAGLDCPYCAHIDTTAFASHMAAPLMIGGRNVGALCISASRQRMFTQEDRQVLGGLANLAAIAVENARLQERVQSVAVLEERERIAREMHDGVGQVLGYVNTKAQAVKVLLDAGKTTEAQAQLAQLEEAAREVYADLREAILGLRTEISPERQLMPALQEYVRRFGEASGIVTELIVEGDPARYEILPTTELHLIRIIQEALTNVRKHAMARRAAVQFLERNGILTVSVTDDGQGFDPVQSRGGTLPRFGLQTMRERAEAIGGTFSIRTRDGPGTEVVVQLPLQQRSIVNARPAGG
jgi:nitrate/nitrite-specific signal transduction histidine kinase